MFIVDDYDYMCSLRLLERLLVAIMSLEMLTFISMLLLLDLLHKVVHRGVRAEILET